MKRRLMSIARKRLSPTTKRRLRRIQAAVLGRRTAVVSRSGSSLARASLGAGDYDEAARVIEAVLKKAPNDPNALELATQIAIQQGEFTRAGQHSVRRMERTRDPAHWTRARKLVGRTRETDPRWQPRLTSSPASATAESLSVPGPVLYLAKESRPFLHNGFCTRTHESLAALQAAGRDVMGVTLPGFPGVIGVEQPPTESVVEGVTYHHLLPSAGQALNGLPLDEYVELTARALRGVVARERPALLHVASGHRGFEPALAANAVARWAGIPWLYEVRSFFETTWTGDARYAERGEYYERRFATESRMMHAADLVITLSGPMRDEIVERHGVPADRVLVVPNAVDPARFAPVERDPELRRQLGLGNSTTLGYVSNLSHPREGQEVLIEAVAKLRSTGRDVTGLLVGDGKRRKELERLASKLGVARHVVFSGNVSFSDVSRYYAQIDVFVVPRVDDRAARMVSPMKPFEAMAMRIPLIVADLPALAEIVGADATARGERGMTYPAGDAAGLARVAALLMDDPDERRRRVEAAADWVARERTWSSVATGFGVAYDRLLESTDVEVAC